MTALLHLGSQIPHTIWFNAKAAVHDQTFWELIVATVTKGSLLIFDLDYTNFEHFLTLTNKGVTFITRTKSNLKVKYVKQLAVTPTFRETIVWIGTGDSQQKVRLIELLYGKRWHRYITNELNPTCLPARD
ncbi:hypothetical protein MNBD_CHLOROFLEXI01-5288 [hydrothermal vent metagenome]|uniref:Transposase IS4-like domain-containing protein n=1 Tax=hydrothermal vent metagenome TaxID=652676 RepID=A0A3B0VR91_9ZZZZ